MSRIWTIGEALIDFVALEPGARLGDVSRFQRAPGGAPANVAAGIACLGGSAGFIGKVGADEFGRFLCDTLATFGVDISRLTMTPEARTALAFVSLTAEGERDFLFYRSPCADMLLRAEEIETAGLTGSTLHFGSLSLIQEPSRSAVEAAVMAVRESGGFVSYDPNLRLALWPSAAEARRTTRDAVRWAHFVKVSEEEMTFLTGEQDIEAGARALLRQGPVLVAVTLGPNGALVATESVRIHVPGLRVDTVDTTGAGDGFVAGFLVRLLERMGTWLSPAVLAEVDLRDVGRFANAVGALVTTRRGAMTALPQRHEVESLLGAESFLR